MKENRYPKLEILENKNQFHGPKVLDLYKYAIDNGIDYIFQTDSDGQTNPDEFEAFWKLRNNYAGIFGNRMVRGDGKARAFVEKVVCFLLKLYFNVNVPDANAPFRLMKTDAVKKYIYKLPDDYKENMIFREISFKSRTAGINSINIKQIFKIGWRALGDFHSLRKGME